MRRGRAVRATALIRRENSMNNYDRHLAAILAAAFIGIAAQPSNAAIPTSAAVAARIDLAKARSLPASSAAIDCLFATVPELGRGGGLLAQNFGIDPRRDISSIEAWADGFTYDGESLALLDASTLARGKFDEARMASSVRSSRGFRRALAGDREIMTADFARGHWIAFPASGTMLVSSSQAAVAKAIGALSRGAGGAAPSTFLEKSISIDCPAVAAIDGTRGARNLSLFTGGLIAADAETLCAKITEANPGTAVLEITMAFADEKTATQVFATINGIKMLASIQEARGKSVHALMRRFIESRLACRGATVQLEMSVTKADIAELTK